MEPPTVLQRLLPSLGISRVADITGLDCIGIPVWSAIQPASKTLCISNGKGFTHEQAYTGAVMEAAEQIHAERAHNLAEVTMTLADLDRSGRISIDLERQARANPSCLDGAAELKWIKGIDLMTSQPVYAPYELTGLDLASDAPWDRRSFFMASSGLGAGFSEEQAILHGLLELIEEDSLFGSETVHDARAAAPVTFCREHATELYALTTHLARMGFHAFLRPRAGAAGTFVFEATVVPHRPLAHAGMPFGGSACRLNRADAAVAAILEAVQSRLTAISGTRDDFFDGVYALVLDAAHLAAYAPIAFTPHNAQCHAEKRSGLRPLLAALSSEGIDGVFAFPLARDGHGIHCVRVLANDLVAQTGASFKVQGKRAFEALLNSWRST